MLNLFIIKNCLFVNGLLSTFRFLFPLGWPPEGNLFALRSIISDSIHDFGIFRRRRNVVIEGISSQELLDSVGYVVQIGSTTSAAAATSGDSDDTGSGVVRVLIHRPCVPCRYMERKNSKVLRGGNGLMEHVWFDSGVSCEVLEGGDGDQSRRFRNNTTQY